MQTLPSIFYLINKLIYCEKYHVSNMYTQKKKILSILFIHLFGRLEKLYRTVLLKMGTEKVL